MIYTGYLLAASDLEEGKIEWFLDDIARLDKASDFRPDVARVWPAEEFKDGGYVLPGSFLKLNYRTKFFTYVNLLLYSPDGQIIPLVTNRFNSLDVGKDTFQSYKLQAPPVPGRAAVIMIASKNKMTHDEVGEIVKNPDVKKYSPNIQAVSFCQFIVQDYAAAMEEANRQGNYGGGYNSPDMGGNPSYSQGGGNSQGNYNQPVYYPGSYGIPEAQPGGGFKPIPINQLGQTYYFYPNGYISRNYNPYTYKYPYYYYRPMYYGFPDQMYYVPQGQRYYVIPNANGVRTNLQDFIFDANFNYGGFTFGSDGFLGGRFYVDGKNPASGMSLRFPVRNEWSHEGPDGNWTYDMPSNFDLSKDFQFFLNGQRLPIYGGTAENPFISIPLQGFLLNGLNEFRLLPQSNPNMYGIGPIEISGDIRF
jgi:hypothetical protein